MPFGCYNDTGTNSAGVGYLSSGSTTNCDGGGNVDTFLVAGNPAAIPTPGTLALVGFSLGLLGWRSRRHS
jgi:hypothetical protein